MLYKEHDVVVLVVDLPQSGFLKGDAGTIVSMHKDDSFEVEFADSFGRMVALETLTPAKVRPLERREVLVARAKAA